MQSPAIKDPTSLFNTLQSSQILLLALIPSSNHSVLTSQAIFVPRFFIYLFGVFYVAFNTVQVISRRVVLWAEETSTYSWSRFCTVNCWALVSNYGLSFIRSKVWGLNRWPQRWEGSVLPLHHHGPSFMPKLYINSLGLICCSMHFVFW